MESDSKRMKGSCRVSAGLGLAVAAVWLSACAAETPTPLPPPTGLNPTHFLQTRIPQVLTENAATLTAQPTPTRTLTPTRTRTLTVTRTPTLTLTPESTPTPAFTDTPVPTVTPTPTLSPTAGPSPRPTIVLSNFPYPPVAFGGEPHFFLNRPVSGGNVFPASSYRFGDTNGSFETHHGVEFGNPQGTALVAAAPGTIYYAGDDQSRMFGSHLNFYGNLVILQLAQTWRGRTVYALYGHMDQVQVQTGQSVNTGDALGTVGYTGVAYGPHLHLEVRLDNPEDYWSAVNPELWLAPAGGSGTLALRVVNEKKQFLPGVRVDIRCGDNGKRYLVTYWDPGAKSDPVYGENAAMTDVPAGYCQLKTVLFGKPLEANAYIKAGEITFVKLAGSRTP
jgi:murein DD-endopeptidase MepM/ murein hydrolase activator NlpD